MLQHIRLFGCPDSVVSAGSAKPKVCYDDSSGLELDLAPTYGSKALDFCRQKSFFVTQAGKLGLGPAHIAVGMLVYLISGLGTPFIVEIVTLEEC